MAYHVFFYTGLINQWLRKVPVPTPKKSRSALSHAGCLTAPNFSCTCRTVVAYQGVDLPQCLGIFAICLAYLIHKGETPCSVFVLLRWHRPHHLYSWCNCVIISWPMKSVLRRRNSPRHCRMIMCLTNLLTCGCLFETSSPFQVLLQLLQ